MTPETRLNFDLDRYLSNSRKLDISDIDLSEAARYPLSDDEIRCLTYMTDIESHTIVYLHAILSTCAIEDPQTTAFLSCWAYEEFFHGHTLGKFLRAAGVPLAANRIADVQRRASTMEWLKNLGASVICRFSQHFHGAYLTYGAISELSTLEGYGVLARRTRNPILAELLRRIAKDERRHFSFYFNKAKIQLQPTAAQKLTSFIIRHFWLPVGGGVKPAQEVDWIMSFILSGEEGAQVAERIDATIAKLPGLEWFRSLSQSRKDSIARVEKSESPKIHSTLDREARPILSETLPSSASNLL